MAKRKTVARPKRRSMKIRSDDRVQVISGKDRGKTGRVLRVEPTKERVYVEHLNMIKRHTRPQQVAGAQSEQQMGGVIEREGRSTSRTSCCLTPRARPPASGSTARAAGACASPRAQARSWTDGHG
jgi:large subunit ribosomal protein L24